MSEKSWQAGMLLLIAGNTAHDNILASVWMVLAIITFISGIIIGAKAQ